MTPLRVSIIVALAIVGMESCRAKRGDSVPPVHMLITSQEAR